MKRPVTYALALTLLASGAAFADSNRDKAALHAKMNPQVQRAAANERRDNRGDNRGHEQRRDNDRRDNNHGGNDRGGNDHNGNARSAPPRVEQRPENRQSPPRVVRENRHDDRRDNDRHDGNRRDHDRRDNDRWDHDRRDHNNNHRDNDRRDYGHDNGRNRHGWNNYRNDWYNHPNYWDNRRRDRRDYAMYRFHLSFYNRPHGYHHRQWYRGDVLPSYYYARPYIVYDWHSYRLYEPPYGYHWVRVDNDIMLTAIATGVVLDVIYGIFY